MQLRVKLGVIVPIRGGTLNVGCSQSSQSQETRLTCARGGYLWSPPILKPRSSPLKHSFFFRHGLTTLFPSYCLVHHISTEFFRPQSALLCFPSSIASPCPAPLLLLLHSLQMPFGPGPPSLALLPYQVWAILGCSTDWMLQQQLTLQWKMSPKAVTTCPCSISQHLSKSLTEDRPKSPMKQPVINALEPTKWPLAYSGTVLLANC